MDDTFTQAKRFNDGQVNAVVEILEDAEASTPLDEVMSLVGDVLGNPGRWGDTALPFEFHVPKSKRSRLKGTKSVHNDHVTINAKGGIYLSAATVARLGLDEEHDRVNIGYHKESESIAIMVSDDGMYKVAFTRKDGKTSFTNGATIGTLSFVVDNGLPRTTWWRPDGEIGSVKLYTFDRRYTPAVRKK